MLFDRATRQDVVQSRGHVDLLRERIDGCIGQ
ncbi:hypothetical protein GA0074692_3990 [Micromonospora pallida]|uniref:Uncharacterized protein n=1 Tax=Micromonospora pallida TaxID=145854 RepID=A0A1C6SZP6_9ACTN|nr:hypothetical protein GA0074692_3990 [Micromonospora pallida]